MTQIFEDNRHMIFSKRKKVTKILFVQLSLPFIDDQQEVVLFFYILLHYKFKLFSTQQKDNRSIINKSIIGRLLCYYYYFIILLTYSNIINNIIVVSHSFLRHFFYWFNLQVQLELQHRRSAVPFSTFVSGWIIQATYLSMCALNSRRRCIAI